MKSELAERVETVYADIFAYPLGLAILLLIVEVFVGEARARVFVRVAPPLPVRGRAALAARSKGKVARPAADRPKKPRSPEASSDERAAPGGMKHAT
jgi:Ca-activated chloride channel family protein